MNDAQRTYGFDFGAASVKRLYDRTKEWGVIGITVLLIAVLWLWASPAATFAADDYPNRPIRLIVPSGAGGITDLLARIVAEKLRPELGGQPVIVENRPGASGMIGSDVVAKAKPDGYTLLMVYPTHPVNPSLYKKLPYDTIKDFAPITMVGKVTQVLLVNPSFPAKSVREIIAIGKKEERGKLNYGSVGPGSLGFLSAELFASLAGLKFTHVAYKSNPMVIAALLEGEIQMFFIPPITAVPQVKSGKLRALGVSTQERLSVLPDVPTIEESGLPGYESTGWNGILAPAKTPREVINRLNDAIVKVLRSPEVIEKFASQGVDPLSCSPDEFSVKIRVDIEKWAKVIANVGIQKID
jgi:tripartite-type tricarboxylate transporter receptor subunit TctC